MFSVMTSLERCHDKKSSEVGKTVGADAPAMLASRRIGPAALFAGSASRKLLCARQAESCPSVSTPAFCDMAKLC